MQTAILRSVLMAVRAVDKDFFLEVHHSGNAVRFDINLVDDSYFLLQHWAMYILMALSCNWSKRFFKNHYLPLDQQSSIARHFEVLGSALDSSVWKRATTKHRLLSVSAELTFPDDDCAEPDLQLQGYVKISIALPARAIAQSTKYSEECKIRFLIMHQAHIGVLCYDVYEFGVVLGCNLSSGLLEERRERAAIREAKAKLKMTKYYNARVRGVTFRQGDFVYRNNDASHTVGGGKLGAKWEGPYKVKEALGDGAYKLRSTDGTVLPRTWNVANLKKCYL
ncbi:hypothetical protein Tco_0785045 [Tanacetum coccineum]